MTDKPIIFSGPMVRALLDGRKTQTRRLIGPDFSRVRWSDPAPDCATCRGNPNWGKTLSSWVRCPACVRPTTSRYAPGDRLYVQENWRACRSLDRLSPSGIRAQCLEAGYRRAWAPVLYEADGATVNFEGDTQPGRFRSPRHMLREFSRLTLTVTDVRVQRLQEISEEDIAAEGVRADDPEPIGIIGRPIMTVMTWSGGKDYSARAAFKRRWNNLHGSDAWSLDPWVAAYTFTVERRNIDARAA